MPRKGPTVSGYAEAFSEANLAAANHSRHPLSAPFPP